VITTTKLVDTLKVPDSDRQYVRETVPNHFAYVPAYSDTYSLYEYTGKEALVVWLSSAQTTYEHFGYNKLRFKFLCDAARKLGKGTTDSAVISTASKKLFSFMAHYEKTVLHHKMPITTFFVKPKGHPVQKAILALHVMYSSNDMETKAYAENTVISFLRKAATLKGRNEERADLWAKSIGEQLDELDTWEYESAGATSEEYDNLISTSSDIVEKIHLLLNADLPYSDTLEMLETLENKGLPKLPDHISVSPFFYDEVYKLKTEKGKHLFPKMKDEEIAYKCGGKIQKDGVVYDINGRIVTVEQWDGEKRDEEKDELDEVNNLDHSPRQEAVEERSMQRYMRNAEKFKKEQAARKQTNLRLKAKDPIAYSVFCKEEYTRLKLFAKDLAIHGKKIDVNYLAKLEGIEV
jgi:hypothetical protein